MSDVGEGVKQLLRHVTSVRGLSGMRDAVHRLLAEVCGGGGGRRRGVCGGGGGGGGGGGRGEGEKGGLGPLVYAHLLDGNYVRWCKGLLSFVVYIPTCITFHSSFSIDNKVGGGYN